MLFKLPSFHSPFRIWSVVTTAWHLLCLVPIITMNILIGRILSDPKLSLRVSSPLLSAAFYAFSNFCTLMGPLYSQQIILLLHAALSLTSAIPAIILFNSLVANQDTKSLSLTWWYLSSVILPVPLGCAVTAVTSVRLKLSDSKHRVRKHQVKATTTNSRNESRLLDHEENTDDSLIGRLYLSQMQTSNPEDAISNCNADRRKRDWLPPYPWGLSAMWSREEEQLPAGWGIHYIKDDRRFFTHVSNPNTPVWRDPRFRTGWSKFVHRPTGKTCYVDHNNRYTTWVKPPLPSLKDFEDDIWREWEKIWIKRANRFFFINHRTGETTWQDKGVQQGLRTDTSQELPPGWVKCSSSQGRAYYVCHNTQTETWFDPKDSLPPLDAKWQQQLRYPAQDGGKSCVCFVDYKTHQTSFIDPRRPQQPIYGTTSDTLPQVDMSNEGDIDVKISLKQTLLAARYTRLYASLLTIVMILHIGFAIALILKLRFNTGVEWYVFISATNWCIASAAGTTVLIAGDIITVDNSRLKEASQDDINEFVSKSRFFMRWLMALSYCSLVILVLWIWHGYYFGRYRAL